MNTRQTLSENGYGLYTYYIHNIYTKCKNIYIKYKY